MLNWYKTNELFINEFNPLYVILLLSRLSSSNKGILQFENNSIPKSVISLLDKFNFIKLLNLHSNNFPNISLLKWVPVKFKCVKFDIVFKIYFNWYSIKLSYEQSSTFITWLLILLWQISLKIS